MLVNPDMYEGSACYDPTTTHLESLIDHHNNFHQPNLIDPQSADYHHLINMELDHHHHEGDGVLKFSGGDIINGIVGKGRDVKDTVPFAAEKRRRQQLNENFDALKNLVPNLTKVDRASVIGGAIEYINELKRTVEELTILAERKRGNRGRTKKHKTKDDSMLDVESINTRPNGGGTGDRDHVVLRVLKCCRVRLFNWFGLKF